MCNDVDQVGGELFGNELLYQECPIDCVKRFVLVQVEDSDGIAVFYWNLTISLTLGLCSCCFSKFTEVSQVDMRG